MKKVIALVAAFVMMFSMATVTYANVISPQGTSTTDSSSDKSPKTADAGILFVELAGAATAVVGVAAAKRARQ